jgi:hypothetical protein
MSALSQKQTSAHVSGMSALPAKADIAAAQINVRFVPKADINHFQSAVACRVKREPRVPLTGPQGDDG